MPGRDDLLRQLIEFGAALRQRVFELEPGFGQRPAADPRIEEIGRLGQRRGRHARRQRRARGSRPGRPRPTSTTSARSGSSRTNSICLSRDIGFGGQHHAGGPGQAGQPGQRLAEHGLDRLRLADRATWASIDCRSGSVRSPTCISASTKKRRPSSVGSRPAEVCGA